MTPRLVVTVRPVAERRTTQAMRTRFVRRAKKMVAAAKAAEVGLLLTGDREIQRLNRSYRKQDKPTDVLGFAMHEGEAGALAADAGLLGDVVISVQTAARQAGEHGQSLEAELAFLFAHGLCHLLGYDHNDDDEEREMNARMKRLLKRSEAA